MPLYTSKYLKSLSANKTINEKARLFSDARQNTTRFDIFLSHSFLDKDEVEGIYIELTSKGYSVYVDWIIDPDLNRNNVTKESAELIRKRMRSSESLLLAISDNAHLSTWIPWELGFLDGQQSRCSLFPVAKNDLAKTTFDRKEYLLLYPYIKVAELDYRKEIILTESSNVYTTLNDWVRHKIQPGYKIKNINFL
jgi:hypothetical protein